MNANIQQTNIQYREIPISQLPDTITNKSRLSAWVTDKNKATVYVVAKSDHSHLWSAYIGYPSLAWIKPELYKEPYVEYHCINIRTQSQVLAYGDMIDKESAYELFPEWAYRKYRE